MTNCGTKIYTKNYRNRNYLKESYSAKNMVKTGHHSTSENEKHKLKQEIHKLKEKLDKCCGPGRHFHHEHHLSDEHGCMNDSDM